MSVDKFGRHTLNNRGPAGRTGNGFNLDINGNFNISDKRITNLSTPTNKSDATNKEYVDSINSELTKQISELNLMLNKQNELIRNINNIIQQQQQQNKRYKNVERNIDK